jgi:hypothetical protein
MIRFEIMILMLSVISIIFASKSTTQAQMPDCPSNVIWDNSGTATLEFEPFQFSGSVQFYERTIGSKVEIAAEWGTLWNNRRPISDETIKELLTIYLAQRNHDISWRCQYPGQITTVSIIDKTECNIRTKCRMKLDMELQSLCCDDPSINPEIYELNGQWFFDIYKNQSCGFKCCEKIITLVCEAATSYVDYYKIVQSIIKQDYPGSECSGTSSYLDCITNQPILCEGNCD